MDFFFLAPKKDEGEEPPGGAAGFSNVEAYELRCGSRGLMLVKPLPVSPGEPPPPSLLSVFLQVPSAQPTSCV